MRLFIMFRMQCIIIIDCFTDDIIARTLLVEYSWNVWSYRGKDWRCLIGELSVLVKKKEKW